MIKINNSAMTTYYYETARIWRDF